jgi:hypothetical protein
VSRFLSEQWFEGLNGRLTTATPPTLPDGAQPCQLVIELTGAPEGGPDALTLIVAPERLRVVAGVVASPDATLRLGFDDAAALAEGRLDSASALREGRVKVRGNVNIIVPLASWLQAVLAG